MDRRGFLKGLIAAPAVAVAAHFNAPEWMGQEIKDELIRDLGRTSVAVPGQAFDNRPIWTSVSGVRQVWVDHVAKELAAQMDAAILKELRPDIDRSVNTMVRAVDLDLRKAEVDEGKKVIIQPPRVRIIQGGIGQMDRKPIFELKAGLEKKKGLFEDEYRVGYLQEAIIV